MPHAAVNAGGLIQPDYDAKGVTLLKDVLLKAISFVDKAANGNRWLLFKSEEGIGNSDELGGYSKLIKAYDPTADDSWETAYVVIAEPNVVDKQKDVWLEEDIRKAAHDFIASGGLLNLQHENLDPVGTLAESAIALVDMNIETPDGRTEVIKKGSWYIGVKPNPEVKQRILKGEITGMSVQGSAKRVEADEETAKSAVYKSDKDNRAIPKKAGGEGIKRVQHLLGVEETEEYDEATEEAIKDWMAKRGTPGIPTIATLKMLLNEQPAVAVVEPAPAPQQPEEVELAPVAIEETEKSVDAPPYNPANNTAAAYPQHPNVQNGVNVGPQPGNLGLRASDVSVDSLADDLKAALGQSLQEGNEALAAYMEETFSGSQVGDLYGRNIPHAELWFMYSKFVRGGQQLIDAEGNLVSADTAPEVEKGAWTGSHGGHDPDAHKGNMQNLVRSFDKWARNDVDVAAEKLLRNGVVKTKEAAYRLASWLKDQHLGTTKWRGKDKVEKEEYDLSKVDSVLADQGEEAPAAPQPPMSQSVAPEGTDKNAATLKRVAQILRAGGSTESVMSQISETLKNRPVGMEGAMGALKSAVAEAAAAPEDERQELIEEIVDDFSRYLSYHTKKSAVAKSAPSFSETPVTEDAPANPTNSPLGEEMDRAYIEENREKLSAAAEFITSILDGQSSDEVPAEVEKDAAVAEEEVRAADAPEAEVPAAPEASDEAPSDIKDELDDEGEDVTEDELIQVLNHVVETLDTLEDRVAQLETLEKKLDQVGELAKALDVTGDIEVLRTSVTELSKALDTAVSSDEMEAIKKSLEDIASTPAAPSAMAVDPIKVAPQVEEVAKSDINPNDAASLWSGTFR